MLDRRENVEPRHTNTCQWILDLEKYQSWISKSRGLLWIKGKPGAGKSTLMVFLHGKLKRLQNGKPGIQLDFFFTARGTEMQRTPLGMLRSLLNQLFDRDATVRPRVRETYEQRCRQFGYGEGKWKWPQAVLEELLAGVILESTSRQDVTIFVDALDETGAESAQQLAAYFHRLIDRAGEKNAALRICISCRHYPIIGIAQAMEIHVEQHNHEDIATYIKDILAETDVEDNPSEDMRQTLMEKIIQQANGVFQWARLIMPLARQRICEGESFDDIYCWSREVPVGLEDVYMYILNNVIEVRNLEQSFLLFQWVCLAERPLTVTEMRYALAGKNAQITRAPKKWEKIYGFIESDERMKRRIKALSGGLAEVVSSRDLSVTVQVVHQSVNDFLLAKGLAALRENIGASSLVLQREEIILQCQANLYRSCLVYLALLRLREDISSDSPETRKDLIRNHPLLAYATINLFIHAQKAAHSRALILLNEQDILQQVIGQWVHIYRILDQFNPACPLKSTTLIHMAAAANLVDIIERMSLNSEDVARKDEDGNTAFHLAARHGHIIGGKILRKTTADCEAINRGGKTPLIEAASYGHTEFVEWLLLEGVSLEATMVRAASALQAASLGGHQSVVEILLGAGADVNAQGGEYGNALQAAAVYGKSSEIVQMLLDAGADVNAQGGRYGNALQAAAYAEGSEIVQMLLNAGVDVNAQGGEYGNALQAAAAYGKSSEIVQMLLDAGADVNAQGGIYGSSLLAAVYLGHVNQVQILLDAGASALLANELDQTPLHIAASKNRLNLLRRFPQLLSPINNRDKLSQTPIHLAICLGHVDFVTNLLRFGADPSLLDGYGKNTLDWAVGNESLLRQIHNYYPSIVRTPDNTQELAVHQSILQISDTLLRSRLHFPWPLVQQLGRYLLFVSDTDTAQYLFQLHLSQDTFFGIPIYKTTCDLCTQVIDGSRFVCRICAHMDLCSFCVQTYPFHSRLHPKQKHKTFEVSHVLDRESPLTTSAPEKLKKLIDGLSAPNTHGSVKGPVHDSVAYLSSRVTVPKMTVVTSMALLGPVSMFCLLSFGLIAVSFTYWYTLI
jgi:ankyrin repeat protein